MPFVVATLVVAIVAGYLRGGRLRHLAALPLRTVWLAPAAVTAQLAIPLAPDSFGTALLVLSQLLLLAFLLANRTMPGVWLIAAGIALNALVIDLNGGMPVSAEALRSLGADPTVEEGKHRLLQDADALPFLADIIPVAPLRTVLSVGDLILAAGVARLAMAGMQPAGHSAAGPATEETAA